VGKVILGMFLAIGFLFFVGVVLVLSHSDTANAPSSTAAAYTASESMAVSAPKLWVDYQANEVAADGIYKGKRLAVQGQVASINKDFLDNIVLSLSTPNEFMPVRADLNSDNLSAAAQLHIGQIVQVDCEGGGMVVGSPVLRKCSLSPNEAIVPKPAPIQYPSVQYPAVDAQSRDNSATAHSASNLDTTDRAKSGVTMPRIVYSPKPEYTDEARRNNLEGTVQIVLLVDAQGNPQNITVARSLGMGLDEKAIEAVKQYKFTPATENQTGTPVPVQFNVRVEFRLD
jgi:TonB family protein